MTKCKNCGQDIHFTNMTTLGENIFVTNCDCIEQKIINKDFFGTNPEPEQ